MIEAAKAVTKNWASGFVDKHGTVRDTLHLHELVERTKKDGSPFDRAMIALPFDELAAAIIHHTSKEIAAQKVREVSAMAAQKVTRREYWNKLDRAHHFVAGAMALKSALDAEQS